MPTTKPTAKAEETGLKILEAALELFRQDGFDSATMRGIAQRAGVAGRKQKGAGNGGGF